MEHKLMSFDYLPYLDNGKIINRDDLSKNQIQELTAYLKNTKSKLSGKMLKWQTKRERENVKNVEKFINILTYKIRSDYHEW